MKHGDIRPLTLKTIHLYMSPLTSAELGWTNYIFKYSPVMRMVINFMDSRAHLFYFPKDDAGRINWLKP